MRNFTKFTILYVCALGVLIGLLTNLAKAQEASDEGLALKTEVEVVEIEQAELDRILAPIALYPDTLLSHILVASTYPLEVIQAARWRNENSEFDQQEIEEKIKDKGWDPSVQALVPFTELLDNLSDDLEWLQQLGDAFLLNEDQVLSSVQNLRQKAHDQGNLTDNEYIEVVEEDDAIIIETVKKEIVYVPYYDTRVVYGTWWWHTHPPFYWHRPVHYYWHAGFYWSPRVYIQPSFYFGGFHWHTRHVVVNHHYYHNPHRHHYNDHHRRVRIKEYQRWNHNQTHRRGVRYHDNAVVRVKGVKTPVARTTKSVTRTTSVARTSDRKTVSLARPVNTNTYNATVARQTRDKLQKQTSRAPQKATQYSAVKQAQTTRNYNSNGVPRANTQSRSTAPAKRAATTTPSKPKSYTVAPQKQRNTNSSQPKTYSSAPQRQRSASASQPRTKTYGSANRAPAKTYKQSAPSNSGRDKQKRSNRKDY